MRPLRIYQRAPFYWLTKHPTTGLFLEMRLGKSVITVRALKHLGYKRVLIVAPTEPLFDWQDECAKEYIPAVPLFLGKTDTRRSDLRLHSTRSDAVWFLIHQQGHMTLGSELTAIPWDAVVIDESPIIKNPKAKVTHFYTEHFRRVESRICLTGTPEPEKLQDLFCQMKFMFGSFMGFRNFWQWQQEYFTPIGFDWAPKKDTLKAVTQEVSEKCISLTRKEAGVDVPETYERRVVELPPSLMRTYRELEDNFMLEGDPVKWQGSKFQNLRRLTSGILIDWEGKFEALTRLLRGELAKEPVVVWFAYTESIMRARERLQKAGISCCAITGELDPEERRALINRFKSGLIRVPLIQVELGKYSLTLDRSDISVYFERPTGYLARKQSKDRTVLPGKAGNLVIDIIVKDTVDAMGLDDLNVKGMTHSIFVENIKRRIRERHAITHY